MFIPNTLLEKCSHYASAKLCKYITAQGLAVLAPDFSSNTLSEFTAYCPGCRACNRACRTLKLFLFGSLFPLCCLCFFFSLFCSGSFFFCFFFRGSSFCLLLLLRFLGFLLLLLLLALQSFKEFVRRIGLDGILVFLVKITGRVYFFLLIIISRTHV